MRNLWLSLLGFCFICDAYSQTNIFPASGPVGIGTTSPNTSANLHIKTNDFDKLILETSSGTNGVAQQRFVNNGQSMTFGLISVT